MLAACHPAAATQLVCALSSIAAAPTPISLPCCHQAAAHLPLAPCVLRKCLAPMARARAHHALKLLHVVAVVVEQPAGRAEPVHSGKLSGEQRGRQ